jgi:serine/threonine protein phosphatase PrpC
MRIREGDLLLLATDGVFDNLFSDEILTIVKNFTARNTNLKTKASAHILARSIAEAAF